MRTALWTLLAALGLVVGWRRADQSDRGAPYADTVRPAAARADLYPRAGAAPAIQPAAHASQRDPHGRAWSFDAPETQPPASRLQPPIEFPGVWPTGSATRRYAGYFLYFPTAPPHSPQATRST
jgi:hypothetical protein